MRDMFLIDIATSFYPFMLFFLQGFPDIDGQSLPLLVVRHSSYCSDHKVCLSFFDVLTK